MAETLLKVTGLKKYYPIRKGFFNRVVATKKVVDGIDLEITKGETLALVGESGCGKSVLLRVLLGMEEPTEGSVEFFGKDFLKMSKKEVKETRQKVQMIFQDSVSALHPRFTVLQSLGEPLILHGMKDEKKIEQRVIETLEKVGLDPEFRFRNPASLSGGQRQRVVIARALVETPELILADEPISALDVSLQAQVLNLLMDLQDEYHLSMLFVAHDLAVVRQIAEHIMIMYAGQILESAPSAEIYSNAQHPYTQVLLESAPSISKGIRGDSFEVNLKVGDAPDPAKLPSGCVFHPRCIYADERCEKEKPERREVSPGHFVCCHKAGCVGPCAECAAEAKPEAAAEQVEAPEEKSE